MQVLQITQRISSRIFDIIFDVHPESENQIKNNRRAKGEKRNVNKIAADFGGGNAHFFSNGCANTENMPFDKIFYFIH